MSSTRFDDLKMRELSERFDFTPGDLAMNQQGLLSDRQRAKYLRRGHRVPYVAAAGGVLVGGAYGWSAATYSSPPLDLATGFTVGIGLFLVIWLPNMFLKWWILRRPLRDGTVKTVTGRVSFGRRGPGYPIIGVGVGLKGRHWDERPGDRELFAGVPYATLHYLQGWGTTEIHSIEPAEPPS